MMNEKQLLNFFWSMGGETESSEENYIEFCFEDWFWLYQNHPDFIERYIQKNEELIEWSMKTLSQKKEPHRWEELYDQLMDIQKECEQKMRENKK